jgi:hypothetical protein
MSIEVVDYAVPGRLLLKGTGPITRSEMLEAIGIYRTGERRQMAFILDLTHAVLNLSADDIAQIADYMASEMKRSPFGPLAVLAPADETFGLGRMYKSYCEIAGPRQVGIFRNLVAAEQWLRRLS